MDEVFPASTRPDVVLQFGAPPTSRAGQALAAGVGQLAVVGPNPEAADPGRRASVPVSGEADEVARIVLGRLGPRASNGWRERWREADEKAAASVAAALDDDDAPFEGRVARDVAA